MALDRARSLPPLVPGEAQTADAVYPAAKDRAVVERRADIPIIDVKRTRPRVGVCRHIVAQPVLGLAVDSLGVQLRLAEARHHIAGEHARSHLVHRHLVTRGPGRRILARAGRRSRSPSPRPSTRSRSRTQRWHRPVGAVVPSPPLSVPVPIVAVAVPPGPPWRRRRLLSHRRRTNTAWRARAGGNDDVCACSTQ